MEKPIVVVTEQRIETYTLQKAVSQSDLPYDDTTGARPASDKSYTLYADTITLTGPLANPGQNLSFVARKIIVNDQVSVDVSGARAVNDFKPGDLPVQSQTGNGAPGASGANGSDALAPGAICLIADEIVTQSGPVAGTIQTFADWSATVLAPLQKAAETALASVQLPPIGGPFNFNGEQVRLLDNLTGLNLTGAAVWQDAKLALSENNAARLTLTLPKLSIGGDAIMMLGDVNVGKFKTESSAFSAEIVLSIADEGTGYVVVGISAKLNTATIQFAAEDDPAHSHLDAPAGTVQSAIAAVFQTTVTPDFIKAVQAAVAAQGFTLRAMGGDGGRGQDGHDGLPGAPGVDGVKVPNEYGAIINGVVTGIPDAAKGKPGGGGGQAGSPGHSMDGGPGGSITLAAINNQAGRILTLVEGGFGGLPGKPGAQGPGGKGGKGAEVTFEVIGGVLGQHATEDGFAPDGPDGPTGMLPDFWGNLGADGPPGTVTVNGADTVSSPLGSATYDAIAADYPLALLQIVEQHAQLSFIGASAQADYTAVIDAYTWLANITKPFTSKTPPNSGFDAHEIAVRQAINATANTELARLTMGLDYYGHAYNWVPVLSMSALQKRVGELLDIGATIEKTRNAFVQANATAAEKLDHLDTQITQIKSSIASDQEAINNLADEIDNAYKYVESTLAAVNAQANKLNATEYKFKEEFVNYVIANNTNCSFSEVLNAIVGIVKVGAEAITGIGEIKAAVDAAKLGEDVFKVAEKITKVIKAAEATWKSIEGAYQTIQKQLHPNVDAGKIVVEKDKFEKFIAPYLGKFPAAAELNDAVQHYFELVQVHNTTALGYTSLWIKKLRLERHVAHSQALIEKIAADRAAQKSTVVPADYTAFMETAYQNIKLLVLQDLFEFNRAFKFWSLKDQPFSVAASDIASLGTTYATWLNQIDAYLEQSGPYQPFTEEIEIKEEDFLASFALLPKSRQLVFMLDIKKVYPRYFGQMTHITAHSVTIELPDLTPKRGVVYMTLTHSGNAVQNKDADLKAPGALQGFVHAPRKIPFKIDYGDPDNSAGGLIGDSDQGFPGLSPFTLWTLDFSAEDNAWIDFTKIKAIKLKFSGKFI